MLDHVSITVSDLDAAERFYDAVMQAIGVSKVRRSETRLGYGERCDSEHPDRSYLSVKLDDKRAPNYSRHWCFKAPNRVAVVAFWRAGIGNGGADDGPPGIRAVYHPDYYAAFLVDPSGNRIEAVCHLREGA
jgi:catechol 2,3-dioxygenase-like lactoylglutathione lyase family enzyme